jgi:ribosomal protein L21E
MKLNIPFFVNSKDGKACMQVSLLSAIKFFDATANINVAKLDELTGRREGLQTWTQQGVAAIAKLGFALKYYSGEPLEPALRGEEYVREKYAEDEARISVILSQSNMSAVVESTKYLLDKSIFEKKVLTLKEIEQHVRNGHVVIVLLDWNIVKGRNGPYHGHFVIITGFDENKFYVHNSGPEKPEENKEIPKDTFLRAWNAKGTDNDLIVIFGKG